MLMSCRLRAYNIKKKVYENNENIAHQLAKKQYESLLLTSAQGRPFLLPQQLHLDAHL